jgi:hypothetical protein
MTELYVFILMAVAFLAVTVLLIVELRDEIKRLKEDD